jgi:hypothetical protein
MRRVQVVAALGVLLAGCEGRVLAPPPRPATFGPSSASTSTGTATASSTSSGTTGSSSVTASSSTSTSAASSTGSTTTGATTSTSSTSTSSTSTSGTTGAGCTCGANARCEGAQCVCLPGFTAGVSGCEPVLPGDPTTHSQADVCQAWRAGHVVNATSDFTPGATACDPGTLPTAAMDDALRRLNMFRWLVGEGPTTDDPSVDANDQACAVIAANNPAGPDAHHPPSTWTCYSSAGSAGAGSSNIAWGCGSAAGAMDQWMEDWGNATTLGHRRWMINPPLGPVGVGFFSGGTGPYGNASCLGVFGMGSSGPHPAWYAYPPPGFAPVDITTGTWSLHSGSLGVASAQIQVTRIADGVAIPVAVQTLSQGYGEDAISWTASGTPGFEAGKGYRVAVSNLASAAAFTYDVNIVTCP